MSLGPMGMNTGMDINSMVSKMVDAERIPKQQRIDNQRADNETSISSYGRLKESLDTMKYLMADFRHEKAFAARAVDTTDDSTVSATATTEASQDDTLLMCCSLLKVISLPLQCLLKGRSLMRVSCK
ncbi:flagellar hook-associated protein FliD [Vibrio astriarenae]|nr:flagellar hook-associated protein FliD [Vibrio sp. C7]